MSVPVLTQRAVPKERDFEFVPYENDIKESQAGLGIYRHVVDEEFGFVLVRNDADHPITLQQDLRLGTIVECEFEGCYTAETEDHGLAALTAYLDSPKPGEEIKLDCGITVYHPGGDALYRLALVAERYLDLWRDKGGTVKIPETDHLSVPLKDGWSAASLSTKPYPLSAKDRRVVDTTFDKLHEDGKMEWSTEPTPFGFLVFVVWKGDKGRAVVDIRGLNKISTKDSYPVPLQADIIAAVRDCEYISTVDAVSFFYQWLVAKPDRHKFTINSHRGQEHLNVALMGYCNSVQYVQRQLDRILRPHRHFARAYVDDVVIFSRTLEEHEEHLEIIFALFDSLNISLSPHKSFIGYPTATLLGQRVSGLGLSTHREKVQAILSLKFPETLH